MKLKHYLIASEENDYRPWITTPLALGVFVVIIWSLRIFGPQAITSAQSSIEAKDLMNQINNERTQRFIPALSTDTRLVTAAGIKSNDMLNRGYFAHVNPDGDYVWPTIVAQGYNPYLTLGENLAMDFISAEAVVRAWMNSPTHRENIVNEKFQDQGLAAIFGLFEPNHDSILITSLFGTLQNSTPPVSPAVAQATTPPQSPKTEPKPEVEPTAPAQETEKSVPIPSETASEKGLQPTQQILVSSEVKFLDVFRIIIGLLVGLYALFLIIDSIIIHRAQIKRINMHASPHTAIFTLIIITSLFALF